VGAIEGDMLGGMFDSFTAQEEEEEEEEEEKRRKSKQYMLENIIN